MFNVDLFAEDAAQELLLRRLVARLAKDFSLEVRLRTISATGGHGKVLDELGQYVRQVMRFQQDLPDLIVVAIDANCEGYNKRKKKVADVTKQLADRVIHAIPDPHVERWLLLDSRAFKQVLGQGCAAPDQKCEKDRYKTLLAEAVRDTGIEPLIGGLEWTDDLVDAIDLDHVTDKPFRKLIDDLRAKFRQWQDG